MLFNNLNKLEVKVKIANSRFLFVFLVFFCVMNFGKNEIVYSDCGENKIMFSDWKRFNPAYSAGGVKEASIGEIFDKKDLEAIVKYVLDNGDIWYFYSSQFGHTQFLNLESYKIILIPDESHRQIGNLPNPRNINEWNNVSNWNGINIRSFQVDFWKKYYNCELSINIREEKIFVSILHKDVVENKTIGEQFNMDLNLLIEDVIKKLRKIAK